MEKSLPEKVSAPHIITNSCSEAKPSVFPREKKCVSQQGAQHSRCNCATAATFFTSAQFLKARGENLFQVKSHLPGFALRKDESYSGQGGLVCSNHDLHEQETLQKQDYTKV